MNHLVEESWRRMRAWLETHAPGVLENVPTGASPEEIAALETRTQRKLPEDFHQFLAIANGAEESGLFPSRDKYDEMAYSPLPIEDILSEWMMQNDLLNGGDFADLEAEPATGVAADWWNSGWLPFASNGGGDFFCIDTVPTAEGTPGQVISHSHESGKRQILAKSFGQFLRQLADDMEAGKIRHDKNWGLIAG